MLPKLGRKSKLKGQFPHFVN